MKAIINQAAADNLQCSPLKIRLSLLSLQQSPIGERAQSFSHRGLIPKGPQLVSVNFYGTLSDIRADLEYLHLLGTKLKPFFFFFQCVTRNTRGHGQTSEVWRVFSLFFKFCLVLSVLHMRKCTAEFLITSSDKEILRLSI